MATSNYDEILASAKAAMTSTDVSGRKPISSISSPLLSIYLGFLGFASGTMFGLLTGTPTFFGGVIGAVTGVCIAFVLRRRWQRKLDTGAAETFAKMDALEREASELEAEVARQDGAFDRWEQK